MSASDGPELFYRGTILRYSPATGQGLLRSATGRQISFDLQFVTLGPSLRGKQPAVRLEEGLEVGFDVGWTSRGLRASRFFIAPPASEGKAGQERDVAPDEGPGQDEYQLDIE